MNVMSKKLKPFFVLIIIFCLFFIDDVANAEIRSYEGEGIYIMGEFETIDVAKQRALHRAQQNAIEKAGVFVESYTKVENNIVTKDEISIIANGIIKILSSTYEIISDSDNKSIIVKSHIKASIDSDDILKWFNQSKEQQNQIIEENKALQELNNQKEQRIEELKRELELSKNESAKNRIQLELNNEEKSFLASMKSSEALKFISHKDYDNAIKYAEESLSFDPKLTESKLTVFYASGLKLCSDYRNANSHFGIKECFQKMTHYFPDSIFPYFLLYGIYVDSNDYINTISVCDKIIEVNPYCQSAYLSKINALNSLGRNTEIDNVKENLSKYGKYNYKDKLYLGLTILDKKIASDYGYELKIDKGIYVCKVEPNGLGDKMGLARGDLILKVNDNDINSVSTFKLLMYIYNKGCKLDILYDRNGKLYHTKDVR